MRKAALLLTGLSVLPALLVDPAALEGALSAALSGVPSDAGEAPRVRQAERPWSGPLPVRSADAAVSILLSLDELVGASKLVVVGTPRERRSVWEEIGGSLRIVTYTKIEVERSVLGEEAREVWIRTLGGAIGRIGQQVSGEATPRIGEKGFFFLADAESALVVAGMAQGHFRILPAEGARELLRPSQDAGTLLPRRGPTISARERLMGRSLPEAAEEVLRARARGARP